MIDLHCINLVISYEPCLESKLDLLTAIGITSRNESTFKACEALREELLDGYKEISQGREDLLHCKRHCDHCNGRGTIETNEIDGEE